MRRIASATWAAASAGRPSQMASSVRLTWTGATNCTSAALAASGGEGPQVLGGHLEPAAGHGQPAEQLLPRGSR